MALPHCDVCEGHVNSGRCKCREPVIYRWSDGTVSTTPEPLDIDWGQFSWHVALITVIVGSIASQLWLRWMIESLK